MLCEVQAILVAGKRALQLSWLAAIPFLHCGSRCSELGAGLDLCAFSPRS